MRCKKCDGELFYIEQNDADHNWFVIVCNFCNETVGQMPKDEVDYYQNLEVD